MLGIRRDCLDTKPQPVSWLSGRRRASATSIIAQGLADTRRVISIWLRRVIGTWLRRVLVSGIDLDQYVRDTRRKKKKTQNIMYVIHGLIMINHD